MCNICPCSRFILHLGFICGDEKITYSLIFKSLAILKHGVAVIDSVLVVLSSHLLRTQCFHLLVILLNQAVNFLILIAWYYWIIFSRYCLQQTFVLVLASGLIAQFFNIQVVFIQLLFQIDQNILIVLIQLCPCSSRSQLERKWVVLKGWLLKLEL